MASGTLVPWLLGQPLHLNPAANSPEPRQGFVFAKNVLGVQAVWVSTSIPTPRLRSCQGFLYPPTVAVTTVPSWSCHSPQVFSTAHLHGQPSLTVSIKQSFEVRLLGSIRLPVQPSHLYQMQNEMCVLGPRLSPTAPPPLPPPLLLPEPSPQSY